MQELNLNAHGVEAIPGKLLTIHAVEYIIRDKLQEEAHFLVYLLQHRHSGFSRFVCKILKPDSPGELYQQLRRCPFDHSFRLNIAAGFQAAFHTEIYEINGTLLKFQQYPGALAADEAEAFQAPLMKQALELKSQKQYAEAIGICNQVLTRNPYHIDAWINLAVNRAYAGQAVQAIEPLLRAIEVDKNYRPTYLQLANLYLALENRGMALHALELSLDRWPYDSEVLGETIRIALDYDLVELAQAKIAFICKALDLNPETYLAQNPELTEKLAASQARSDGYKRLVGEAADLQCKRQYQQAAALLAQAIPLSKNNEVAVFNYHLCRFHLGEADILFPLVQLYSCINDVIRQGYCLLLAFLTAVDQENYALALDLADILEGMLRDGRIHTFDLPGIPYHYYWTQANESMDLEPVIRSLNTLRKHTGDPQCLQVLYDQYQQLKESCKKE